MKYLEDILIAPLISEKSYDRIANSNSYTFFVHTSATKPEIKKAVEEIFDVEVLSVNTMYKKGKKEKIWLCYWSTKYKKSSNCYFTRWTNY
jgi:large subunit ribosomal protein L23